jgi:two-component system, chemotaxis family, chemotaxis protein CheY
VAEEPDAEGESEEFRLTAVVVDDAPLMRQMLKQILMRQNFEVVGEAGDGHEALEVVDKTRPHLVTMDITMPVMDGLESLARIKRDHPNIQVVVVSAFGERSNILEAIRLGASNFIVKPFDEPKVVRVINSVKF